MRSDMQARLEELQGEFRAGEARLRELDLETARLRETLLRISGAMQVLQELLDTAEREPGAVPVAPEAP
jgi:predicted nuclease with TOPRIM domain